MFRPFTAAVALALLAAPALAAGQPAPATLAQSPAVQGKADPAKPAAAAQQDVKKKAPATNAAAPTTPAKPPGGTVTR
jgi:hypothetical protein